MACRRIPLFYVQQEACKRQLCGSRSERYFLHNANTTRECANCRYPKCTICKLRETSYLSISEYKKRRVAGQAEEQYTCRACKYPPRQGCKKTPRLAYNEMYTIAKMPPRWTCAECLKHTTLCMFCGEGKQVNAFHKQDLQNGRKNGELSEARCSDCTAGNVETRTNLTCSTCSKTLPQAPFADDVLNAVSAENRMCELYCVKCAQGAVRSRWCKLGSYTCTLCKEEKQGNAVAAADLKNSHGGAQ